MGTPKYIDKEDKIALEKLSLEIRNSRAIKKSKKKEFFETVLSLEYQKIVRDLLKKLEPYKKKEKIKDINLKKRIVEISIEIIGSVPKNHSSKSYAEIYRLFGKCNYGDNLDDAFGIAHGLGELPQHLFNPYDDLFLPKKYHGKSYKELESIVSKIFQKVLE